MGRIALIGIGTWGDIAPMIWLGLDYKKGHDVTVYANDVFKEAITESGLGFASIGDSATQHAALNDTRFFDVSHSAAAVHELMLNPHLSRLSKHDLSESYVVAQPYHRTPANVRAYLQPCMALAYPTVDRNSIALFPRWFAPKLQFGAHVGFPCYEPPFRSAFDATQVAGRVLVTFGTGGYAVDVDREAIRLGCEDAGFGVYWLPAEDVPHIPLSKLLPHCRAIIHHGGVGTIATAHACSTRQVIIPLAYDQLGNGFCARLTMGAHMLDRATFTRADVAAALG